MNHAELVKNEIIDKHKMNHAETEKKKLTHDEPCWKGEKIIDTHMNQFTLHTINLVVKKQREYDKIKNNINQDNTISCN